MRCARPLWMQARKHPFQPEPIAAALDYEQRIDHEAVVLVVDIGGAPDFTVVRLGPWPHGTR